MYKCYRQKTSVDGLLGDSDENQSYVCLQSGRQTSLLRDERVSPESLLICVGGTPT